ncbi:MAG: hypothetical protein H6923_01895 [Alphaproteobacteria bacterium]|nr:hypothetical protein [Alphaproteobacteria bacterium]
MTGLSTIRPRGLAIALCALGATLLALPGAAAAKATQYVIGLDLSKSNPLVTDSDYARKVATRIEPLIQHLEFMDIVTLRTFGSYNTGENALRIDKTISKLDPAEKVSIIVREVVAGVPRLIESGRLKAQPSTNMLAFMENMAEVVDCKKVNTTFILITDGIEDSAYARLIAKGATLPEPRADLFKGCQELQILGLGQGQSSPEITVRLREQWTAWAEKAGFKSFLGLNDW